MRETKSKTKLIEHAYKENQAKKPHEQPALIDHTPKGQNRTNKHSNPQSLLQLPSLRTSYNDA